MRKLSHLDFLSFNFYDGYHLNLFLKSLKRWFYLFCEKHYISDWFITSTLIFFDWFTIMPYLFILVMLLWKRYQIWLFPQNKSCQCLVWCKFQPHIPLIGLICGTGEVHKHNKSPLYKYSNWGLLIESSCLAKIGDSLGKFKNKVNVAFQRQNIWLR